MPDARSGLSWLAELRERAAQRRRRFPDYPDTADEVAELAELTAAFWPLQAETMMGATVDCAHCLGPQVGSASVAGQSLCHPDGGLDCYRLVTVYHHDMPCAESPCPGWVRTHKAPAQGGG